MSPLAYTASAWTQVIVACSIFVPVAVAVGLTCFVLHGKISDPDEQRCARLAEQRREAERRTSER